MLLGRFLLIMFLIINRVSSKEDSTNVEVHKSRILEPSHPPSVEYYNPIPVVIVYDDEIYSSGRSVITTEALKSDKNVKVSVTKKENIATSTEQEETTTVAVKSTDTRTKVESIPKARALNDLQIPVAVIYESDSNSYQNHYKTKIEITTETPKFSPNSRRNQQSNVNIGNQNKQTAQILKAKIETSQTDIETTTIGKRTEGRGMVVPILEYENYVFSHSGNFHYRYEAGDGTKAYSEGKLKTIVGKTGETVVGGFSYTDKEGNDFNLSYTADENGYRPVGTHLPTPPPIPAAIARALKYLATATPEPVTERPVELVSR